MATTDTLHEPKVAKVDFLVDSDGYRIDVPDDSSLQVTRDAERVVGATGPTSWWQLGLVALGIVAAILLALQLLAGNPGTDMIPGTPVAAPQALPQPQ